MLTSSDQPNTSSFPGFLGVFGVAAFGVLTCVAGGFFLGSLLFIAYIIVYQVVALFAYTVRYIIRARHLDREIAAARLAAGDLALPEAHPAPAQRIQWGTPAST